MLKGFIPHSGTSQFEVTRSVALVILTDFSFTTYKASGTLRYANHTRLGNVCDDLARSGEERLVFCGLLVVPMCLMVWQRKGFSKSVPKLSTIDALQVHMNVSGLQEQTAGLPPPLRFLGGGSCMHREQGLVHLAGVYIQPRLVVDRAPRYAGRFTCSQHTS
jgi:hypothetical protein